MKRLVYVLSAAVLLTAGIFACSKEQNVQQKLSSTEEMEVKRGNSPVLTESGFLELQLPNGLRTLDLIKTKGLDQIVVEEIISTQDKKGNNIDGIARLHLSPSAGKVTRIEVSENIATAKGLDTRSIFDIEIGDDLVGAAGDLGNCINACNQSEIDQLNQGCGEEISPQDCVDKIETNARKCRRACYIQAGLDIIKIGIPFFF